MRKTIYEDGVIQVIGKPKSRFFCQSLEGFIKYQLGAELVLRENYVSSGIIKRSAVEVFHFDRYNVTLTRVTYEHSEKFLTSPSKEWILTKVILCGNTDSVSEVEKILLEQDN